MCVWALELPGRLHRTHIYRIKVSISSLGQKYNSEIFLDHVGLHFNIADLLKRGGSVLSLANLVDYNITISRGFKRNTFAR